MGLTCVSMIINCTFFLGLITKNVQFQVLCYKLFIHIQACSDPPAERKKQKPLNGNSILFSGQVILPSM